MPCVLWGVSCLSLPGPTTAAEVIQEFRDALSLQARGAGAASVGGADKLNTSKSSPRVDLYRLVRIEDQAGDRLSGEEQVVAHLPDSSWGCQDIEDMCRQRDDAEVRYERARESLVSLTESLDFGQASQSANTRRPVLSLRGVTMTPQVQQLCSVMKQENKVLRYKLKQSENMNKELQETCEMVRREFMLLVQEIMPRGAQGSSLMLGSGPGIGAASEISQRERSAGTGPLIPGLPPFGKASEEPQGDPGEAGASSLSSGSSRGESPTGPIFKGGPSHSAVPQLAGLRSTDSTPWVVSPDNHHTQGASSVPRLGASLASIPNQNGDADRRGIPPLAGLRLNQ